jgi:hypothetical protein
LPLTEVLLRVPPPHKGLGNNVITSTDVFVDPQDRPGCGGRWLRCGPKGSGVGLFSTDGDPSKILNRLARLVCSSTACIPGSLPACAQRR